MLSGLPDAISVVMKLEVRPVQLGHVVGTRHVGSGRSESRAADVLVGG